jgi:sigma-E factor negative regulatory protein RseB
VSRSGVETGWLGAMVLGSAFFLAGSIGRAQDTSGAAQAATPQPPSWQLRNQVQWLQAIRSAAQRSSYTGTIVYQHGDEVRSSRIVHYFDGTIARERVQTLDGWPREFIREGDQVQCLYPRQRRIVIEQGGVRAAFPALGQVGLSRVLEHYALTSGDLERVAGIDCKVLQLVPRDTLRYGYRLWVHPDSGLLLKIQVVGPEDAMIEQIAFSDVRIGEPIDRAQLKPSWSTAGWEVVRRHPSREIELSRQGWIVTAPEGFHRLTEVERELGNGSSQEAMQAVFTDGLATVSVFIEPGAAPADPAPVQQRAPWSAFMRRVGDARVTVVGEVPATTVRSIADSVHFDAPTAAARASDR